MATLTLKYSRRKKAFRVVGAALWLGPARADEFEDVADYFGRRLCDNPALQSALGVLGAESVEFEQAEGRT